MKAISCSQCGAVIKGISSGNEFVRCTYCDAEIRIREEKIVEIPDAKDEPTPYQKYLKKRDEISRKHPSPYASNVSGDETERSGILKVFVLFFLVIGGIVLIVALNRSSSSNPEETDRKIPLKANTPATSPIVFPDTPTPMPEINYRTYIKYTTSIGAEHLEHPALEADELPTLDKKELAKTVFAEKRIRVRITIAAGGEVIDAKALNGHPVLQESSMRAAKRSLFSERKKEAQTVLTYIFVLE